MAWSSASPEWRKSNPEWIRGVGLICGANLIRLDLPQRGLGKTGKFPITTEKRSSILVVCFLELYFLAIYFDRIKFLTCLLRIAIVVLVLACWCTKSRLVDLGFN